MKSKFAGVIILFGFAGCSVQTQQAVILPTPITKAKVYNRANMSLEVAKKMDTALHPALLRCAYVQCSDGAGLLKIQFDSRVTLDELWLFGKGEDTPRVKLKKSEGVSLVDERHTFVLSKEQVSSLPKNFSVTSNATPGKRSDGHGGPYHLNFEVEKP